MLSLLFSLNCLAQEDSSKVTNTVLPILFYLPETSLGFGGTGITTIRKSQNDSITRPSQILYSAVYTLKKQILLFAPFEFYGYQNKFRIKGEVGYYKYFYNYFGIGAVSGKDNLETYQVLFPRVEVNYARRIRRNLFLGVGFNFDEFKITEVVENGLLDSNEVIGKAGGTKANILGLIIFDNRDNIVAASKGFYAELRYQRSLPDFISDFNYDKWTFDGRYYFNIKEQLVVANQLFWSYGSNSSPFFDLPYVSTPAIARGFDDRRFINYKLLNLQTEIRFPIFRWLRGASFIALTDLPDEDKWLSFQSPKISYGLGLRFEINKANKTRLRLDLARSSESFNIYFTVNEAF